MTEAAEVPGAVGWSGFPDRGWGGIILWLSCPLMSRPGWPPEPELHRAARTGDIETLQRLHRAGVEINGRIDIRVDDEFTLHGLTPLMVAARSIDGATVETLKWLSERGADLRAESDDGLTAAWFAAGKGGRSPSDRWRVVPDHVDRLRFLLDAGGDSRGTRRLNPMLLIEACEAGDPARVKLLLERGAVAQPPFDPEEAARQHRSGIEAMRRHLESRGLSSEEAARRVEWMAEYGPATALDDREIPLFIAAESGCAECVRLIVERGADPNTRDSSGDTALMKAGSAAVVAALLRAGADPNLCGACDKDALDTFLCGGSERNLAPKRRDMVQVLLDAGVSIERGPTGRTRLWYAALCNNLEAVEFLLERGVDPHAREEGADRESPLHTACWHQDDQFETTNTAQIIERLIAAGVDPNVRDDRDETPLHSAVFGDGPNLTAVRTLLQNGADPDPINHAGCTPLMLAVQLVVRPECVRLLLDAGADPLREDAEGCSAIHHAEQHLRRSQSYAESAEADLASIEDGTILPEEFESGQKHAKEWLERAVESLRLLTDAANRRRPS